MTAHVVHHLVDVLVQHPGGSESPQKYGMRWTYDHPHALTIEMTRPDCREPYAVWVSRRVLSDGMQGPAMHGGASAELSPANPRLLLVTVRGVLTMSIPVQQVERFLAEVFDRETSFRGPSLVAGLEQWLSQQAA